MAPIRHKNEDKSDQMAYNISKKLERPVEDYLTGYEREGKWVPGLVETVANLKIVVYLLVVAAVGHFFGIDTLKDLITLVGAIRG